MNKIVVIGGGTGAPTITRGLINLDVHVTTVTTMFDNGGSSGEIRDVYGSLPPGDFCRAVVAHQVGEGDRVLREIFSHRFSNGKSDKKSLGGHTCGNILFLACVEKYGQEEAVRVFPSLFSNTRGQPLPVSIQDAHLCAELSDDSIIEGETNIDCRDPKDDRYIKRVFLNPEAVFAYLPALEAIRSADMVVLSCGDFFTSLVPNLLVRGVAEAIATARSVVFVSPLMTKGAETKGYTVARFIEELRKYGVERPLDAVVVNNQSVPGDLLAFYSEEENAFPVELGDIAQLKILAKTIVQGDYLDANGFPQQLIRHESIRIGQQLMQIMETLS